MNTTNKHTGIIAELAQQAATEASVDKLKYHLEEEEEGNLTNPMSHVEA
jgi:hypothetical protein